MESYLLTSLIVVFTSPWVVLALLSNLCDATVGFIDEWLLKKIDTKKDTDIDAPGQLLLISGLFGLCTSLIVLIYAFLSGTDLHIFSSSFWIAYSAGILEVLWLIPYFYALNNSGALNATPLFQTIPIFSLLFGLSFFGEIPSLTHILATIIILGGALILNYSPTFHTINIRTVFLMLLASSIISLGFFFFKDAALGSNFFSALFGNGIGMGCLSIFIWMIWKPYRQQFLQRVKSFDKRILFFQTANEGLYALAATLNNLAIVLGPSVMAVSALNAFHPVFTLLVGWSLTQANFLNHKSEFAGNGKYIKLIAVAIITTGAILLAQ